MGGSVSFPLSTLGGFNKAWLVCLLMSSIYVLSMYTIPGSVRALPRNDPKHIRARLFMSMVSSGIALLILYLCSSKDDGQPTLLQWTGLRTDYIFLAPILSLALTFSLFLGPTCCMVGAAWVGARVSADGRGGWVRPEKPGAPFAARLATELAARSLLDWPLQAARNFLVGPLTEEFVFRGCMCPLLLCAGVPLPRVVFLGPLVFGVAHLHHAYERTRSGVPVAHALLAVGFQLSYTSLFGAYAGFVFLRTGQLWAAFWCHAFCNFMGLPDVSFFSTSKHAPLSVLYPYRFVFLATYLVGIGLFGGLLFKLTEPSFYPNSSFWEYYQKS